MENIMASQSYPCIICQQCITSSVIDLHLHHIRNHSSEELSLSVLSLQGLNICSPHHLVQEQSPTLSYKRYNSNQDCNYEYNQSNYFHFQHGTFNGANWNESQQENDRNYLNACASTSKHYKHEEKLSLQNEPMSDIYYNETQFSIWEHELNKGMIVDESDFMTCAAELCNDLSIIREKGKSKRMHSKKQCMRSVRYTVDLTSNHNTMYPQQKINPADTEDTINNLIHIPESEYYHKETGKHDCAMLSTGSGNSVYNIEIENRAITDNKCIESTDVSAPNKRNTDVLAYNPTSGKLSWVPLFPIDDELKEFVCNTNGSI